MRAGIPGMPGGGSRGSSVLIQSMVLACTAELDLGANWAGLESSICLHERKLPLVGTPRGSGMCQGWIWGSGKLGFLRGLHY